MSDYTPYDPTAPWHLFQGDCVSFMRAELRSGTVDSLVTDPPAGIEFLGREWDSDKGGRDAWIKWLSVRLRAAYRALKPGGHALIWSLPRTSHWTGMALEDAGFEIRDTIHHVYGTAMPKGKNISQEIDRKLGGKRKVLGRALRHDGVPTNHGSAAFYDRFSSDEEQMVTAPGTPEAEQWHDWNTTLKPMHEIWWLARKPLRERNVVENVLKHGAGAINVGACRVGSTVETWPASRTYKGGGYSELGQGVTPGEHTQQTGIAPPGRWPPNMVFTHAADCDESTCVDGCPVLELDQQSGDRPSALTGRADPNQVHKHPGNRIGDNRTGIFGHNLQGRFAYADDGGASRWFPCFHYERKIKARADRELPDGTRNEHVTLKSLGLMRWFVRLITPPGGLVLDPFAGSGTTGVAAIVEGMRFVGCELTEQHAATARLRLEHAKPARNGTGRDSDVTPGGQACPDHPNTGFDPVTEQPQGVIPDPAPEHPSPEVLPDLLEDAALDGF